MDRRAARRLRRVRRVLPLRRQRRTRAQERRGLHRPARRLHPRRPRDHDLQQVRDCDGVHGAETVSPLKLGTYYVYLLTNRNHNVLYTGVTNNLERRLYEHKNGLAEGFTKRYRVHKLVYFETTSDVKAAIAREKQIKSWSRARKNALIEAENPHWRDLAEDWE